MTDNNRCISGPLAAFFRFKHRTPALYYHYKRKLSFLVRAIIRAFQGDRAGWRSPAAQRGRIYPEDLYRAELDLFLASGARLVVKPCIAPIVSIVLVLYNRAELTLKCLTSLHTISKSDYELIIIDNASTDDTRKLLNALSGAKVVRNGENTHFLQAVNQAADLATGTYLLFLNNDAQLLQGALDSAVDLLEADSSIGAVGAKVVRLDGKLQEAGNIIWRDGSCQGYGRDESPLDSEYMFQRDVDYCSAVFLLTNRTLFLENSGFDPAFAPAYYEETDYCMRLRELGKRIVYNPGSVVLHFEFASSRSPEQAIALQKAHREVFRAKHSVALAAHFERSNINILKARCALPVARRILHIDDRVPHSFLGSGYPRSRDLLLALDALGCQVTFYPLLTLPDTWEEVYSDIPRTVEVVADGGIGRLKKFLKTRTGYYTSVIVSRPHNMHLVKQILGNKPAVFAGAQLIYDAEAVYALRDIKKISMKGEKFWQTEQDVVLEEELLLAQGADRVVTVSRAEQLMYIDHGYNDVQILGHTVSLTMTPNTFKQRRDILFVGAFSGMESPNTDSMLWFVEKVLPLIRAQLDEPFKFIIAGNNSRRELHSLQHETVDILGTVEDLTELYDACRVFVVPTRYCAGIPYKAHHAAAHGIPLVVTGLIGGQLGWAHEQDVLIADSAEDFAAQCVRLYRDEELWSSLRNCAAGKIKKDCSRETFIESVRTIIA